MIKKVFLPVIIIIISLFSFSCVSSKQFAEIQEQSRKYQDERDMLKAENEKLTIENTEMTSKVKVLEDEVEKLTKEIDKKSEEFEGLNKNYQILKRGFHDLQSAQEQLAKGNNRETRRLLKQLQTIQEELMAREDELRGLEKSLDAKKRNLEEMQYEVEKRNTRLLELEKILKQKDAMMADLKSQVSSALMGFENNELTVNMKNGKVYVSLEEKLLFKTGSYLVAPNGIRAIKNLARVLEQNRDIYVLIEGHTDNVPYQSSGGHIQDNWDLSVKRATSIVKILLDNSNIDPKRVTAAGRGEFYPVDLSNTPEARQKNRRTEIILTPDLDKLYEILETY